MICSFFLPKSVFQYPLQLKDCTSYDGKNLQITSWYVYLSSSIYLLVRIVLWTTFEKCNLNIYLSESEQDVKFSMSLDVFDMCTPELQQKLTPVRERFKIEDDARLEEIQKVLFFSFLQEYKNSNWK